ncbi:MAG: sigma-70 family RNA polymerase sigma factor [Acidobacteria bacterium]|nr:sigma-70 family RNA polymerase sigma factor [Acidobacteriota bacterium]
MFRVNYISVWEFEACCTCETMPDGAYVTAPPQIQWSSDEIERIRAVLQKLTSLRVENDADVEDLVQETLLTMTLKCPAGGPDKGLLIWSMGILRKKIGNYYRRARRYVPMECTHLADRIHLHPSPELKYLQSELVALVQKILAGFPQRDRETMELCLSGLPTHEIAALLVPERYQNVVNRIFRGRRRIARRLAEHGYFIPIGPRRRERPPRRSACRTCKTPARRRAPSSSSRAGCSGTGTNPK